MELKTAYPHAFSPSWFLFLFLFLLEMINFYCSKKQGFSSIHTRKSTMPRACLAKRCASVFPFRFTWENWTLRISISKSIHNLPSKKKKKNSVFLPDNLPCTHTPESHLTIPFYRGRVALPLLQRSLVERQKIKYSCLDSI